MSTFEEVAPGFINLDGTRYAVSQIQTWKNVTVNGGAAVGITTLDSHYRIIPGVTAGDIDKLVKGATHE